MPIYLREPPQAPKHMNMVISGDHVFLCQLRLVIQIRSLFCPLDRNFVALSCSLFYCLIIFLDGLAVLIA